MSLRDSPAPQALLPPRRCFDLCLASLAWLVVGCAPTTSLPETEVGTGTQYSLVEGSHLEVEASHARVGRVAREPMMVEHPNGSWFVTGYGAQDPLNSSPLQPPSLWRSDDQGTTWSSVDVGVATDGAYGNSDVDLSIGPEGNLYFIVMGFDRSTFRGTHVTVGRSADEGRTWSWSVLSETEFDDRPWVRAAPDGRVHAIWNDGAGVSHARSSDGGLTWTELERIHPAGGSSHLAIGPGGELAVRIGPMSASGHRSDPGEDWIAVSVDGGDDWTLHEPPGEGRWPTSIAELGTHPRWVDPLAWTAGGDLLHAWSADDGLHVARSVDRGASWTRWLVAPAGDRTLFFPYLTGGFDVARPAMPPETFALTWFERSGSELRARIARLGFENDTLKVERTLPLDLPIRRQASGGDEPTWTPDTGGEYFPAILDRAGRVLAATTIQNDPAGDGFSIWKETVR